MQKILIVEDNKTLAKLIVNSLSKELDMQIDIAYNFSEAKLFLKMYDYFLTILDLNLPDAPNGEIVDYALKQNNRVIILSASIDKNLRKDLLKKNIIDYVNKNNITAIDCVINTIKRVKKNQNHKILVVDDSMVFRKQMKTLLENLFYQVTTVAHGEEALNLLELKPDVSLVLTDYNMPVINGLELTQEIRKTRTKQDISIIALSSNNDDEVTALFLKNGANDYIKKPFSKEEFSCRVNNAIEALENIHLITNHAKRDFLTGLYNRHHFLEKAHIYFDEAIENDESFAVCIVDIDNLKNINDTYGDEDGDKIIVHISEILRANTSQDAIIARFSSDIFGIILKNTTTDNALNTCERLRLETEKSIILSKSNLEIKCSISIGLVTQIEDTLEETINQADMLLYTAKKAGKNQIISN